MTRRIYIFDDGKGEFGPLVDRRAIFEQRSGAVTIRERIERVLGVKASGLWVNPKLLGVVKERVGSGVLVNEPIAGGEWVVVNGRWNGVYHADAVRGLMRGDGAVLLSDAKTGDVIAMRGHGELVSQFLLQGCQIAMLDGCTELIIGGKDERILLERPWHILDELGDALLEDLAAIQLPVIHPEEHINITAHGSHEMRVASTARLLPYTVVDAQYGPVVIDEGAEINPLTVLQGPCYVGPNAVLVSHTSLRRNTVIGPWCKVGGEISGAIMQGYSNKVHDGFLGMSLVGEWVNLGADTNVSNLKNTYGNVRIRLGEETEVEDTKRQFQGPIFGDYVRTGIGTRVNTGAVLGTGCMFAGSHFTPKYARPFGFFMDGPDGMERNEYEWEKFLATAESMMSRRNVTMNKEEESLLRDLYDSVKR